MSFIQEVGAAVGGIFVTFYEPRVQAGILNRAAASGAVLSPLYNESPSGKYEFNQ